jgi:hypothetical protein
MVVAPIRQHHPFNAHLRLLVFHLHLQPFPMLLGLPPDAAGWNQPFPDFLKHRRTLLIRQQSAQPHHPSR